MKKIYSLFLFCFLTLVSVAAQTTIYAYRTWQESNSTNVKKGPVKFSSANPSEVELIADQSRLGSVYAGAYYNYKWYAQVTQPGTQSALEGLYTIDLNDGTRTLISTKGAHLVEMTYDYASSTMYGVSNNAEELMIIDIHTGETTSVGTFQEGETAVYILALACDVEGTMYGISTSDNLYTIDKATAACTLVGPTGVDAAFTQSMDFDRNSGVLYWLNNADYTLYTVDTTTGQATAVGTVGELGDESLNSMFIPYIHVAPGAPDRVTERRVEPQGTSVRVVWKNPTIDAQGNPLTQLTGIKVYRNNELVATVTAGNDQIGTLMEYTDTNLSDGLYSYRLVPVNAQGDGGADSDDLQVYVGDDAPGTVVDFTVTQGDSEALLNWKAPETGKYGGTFDPASITGYVITRSDGTTSETIAQPASATTYADTPGFGTYTYSIYAENNVGKGTEVSADPIIVKPADWILMVTGEVVIESGKTYHFYDVSGPDAYYPNSRNDTLTIRPENPGGLVHVSFPIGYSAGTLWPDVKLLFTDVTSGMTRVVRPASVQAYPNPVSGLLHIDGDGLSQVELYNCAGQRVYVSGPVTSIDMTACPAGIYYLKIVTDEGVSTVKKIVKN
ncbi:MAG TPA: T9SS type A sorting domain-containing protein [Candidatus Barnesiella excrementavium]|nr:T9SS type A sorting domain-containing protein [Candidatus Barnesiella excrementavium]